MLNLANSPPVFPGTIHVRRFKHVLKLLVWGQVAQLLQEALGEVV